MFWVRVRADTRICQTLMPELLQTKRGLVKNNRFLKTTLREGRELLRYVVVETLRQILLQI